MANRVAVNTLNASTLDILNVIRENATYEYQSAVPVVEKATDIPRVGEIIYGTPSLANQFINALVNRIALVVTRSTTFNNPYAILKKGYLEFGESVEEIFIDIAKVVNWNPEKAYSRELKRSLPNVRSAFHIMNWKVMYPVTIDDDSLRQAFLSIDGVRDLIASIVESVYKAAQYDEYLLFKYMLIKAIAHGKMYPIGVDVTADIKNSAKSFRGSSNLLTFMNNEYNEAGVLRDTPRDRQIIFMDSMFNAEYDVDVLASAFNMDKADFMGRLFLIDDWTKFDNDRFSYIRSVSDGLEEITAEELTLMNGVKAVIADSEWFQVYDNMNKFTEKYVASGPYWNYFYHTWKTFSSSPFANAIVFVEDTADIALPTTVTVEIMDKAISEEATVFSVLPQFDGATLKPSNVLFIQTEAATQAGIGITKYGAIYIPASASATDLSLQLSINGTVYTATTTLSSVNNVGTTIELTK